MNNTGTCPDTDSDFLKCAKPKSPRAENSYGSWHFFKRSHSLINPSLAWKISKLPTCIAVISHRHISPPTLCIYPALATRHGICNRHAQAGMSNQWKATLGKRTKLKLFPKQNKHGRQSFLLNFKGSTTSATW